MDIDIAAGLPIIVNDLTIILKSFYLLGLFFYLIFAVVMIRQVEMMITSLSGQLHLPVRPIAWIHFAATLVVFFAAALIL